MNSEDFKKLKIIVDDEICFDENSSLDSMFILSTRLPNVYQRYLDVYTNEFEIYKNLIADKDKKFGNLLHFYKYKDDYKWDTKHELDAKILSDKSYYDLQIKCNKQEAVVKYLEKTLTNITNMGHYIKSCIEIKKYYAGMGL